MDHKRKESLVLAEYQTDHLEVAVRSCLDTVVIMEINREVIQSLISGIKAAWIH